MVVFESERLYVRHFLRSDLDSLAALAGDPDVMKYIRKPMSKAETRELLDLQINGYSAFSYFGRFAVIEKTTSEYIGNFVLRPSDTVSGIELGYAFLKFAWGKGYATELTFAGLAFAFEWLKLDKVYAVTEIPNEASKRVLKKTGFYQLPNVVDKGREVCLFKIEKLR